MIFLPASGMLTDPRPRGVSHVPHPLPAHVRRPTPAFAADPPKGENAKRNPTVERVKLLGVGGLLEQEAVRKDLGLSKEQCDKLAEAKAEVVKEVKGLYAAAELLLRSEQKDYADYQVFYDKIGDYTADLDARAVKVLTADQVYRLKQLRLQLDGPTALLGRYAARELALTPEQEDKLADALKPLTRPKLADMLTNGILTPDDPKVAKLLQQRAAVVNECREAAEKVLTKEQKAKWKEMTGEAIPTVSLLVGSREAAVTRLAMAAR